MEENNPAFHYQYPIQNVILIHRIAQQSADLVSSLTFNIESEYSIWAGSWLIRAHRHQAHKKHTMSPCPRWLGLWGLFTSASCCKLWSRVGNYQQANTGKCKPFIRACGCVWTLQMYLISLLFGVNYFSITFLHNDVLLFFFFLLIFYYLISLRIWLNFRLLLEKQNRLKAEERSCCDN